MEAPGHQVLGRSRVCMACVTNSIFGVPRLPPTSPRGGGEVGSEPVGGLGLNSDREFGFRRCDSVARQNAGEAVAAVPEAALPGSDRLADPVPPTAARQRSDACGSAVDRPILAVRQPLHPAAAEVFLRMPGEKKI